MPSILNLGAGNRLVSGAVNHDLRPHRPEIDVCHDLDRMPWPWEDNRFGRIEAWSVFEHLAPNLVMVMDECWRILGVSGLIHIKLPMWDVDQSWADPTHIWHYSLRSLDLFDPDTRLGGEDEFYTERKWRILEPGPEKCSSSSFHIRLTPRGKS